MHNGIKQIFGVAKTEFVEWITNPRIIIVGVLLIFIKTLAIEPLAARADKFGESLIWFEPFVAVGNSSVLAMFIPLVFLVLISDYPRLHGNALFFISRTGKRRWLIGQILFLITAVVVILAVILLMSMLFSGGQFGDNWSEAVRKYNARFPNEAFNFDSQLLPSNLYNQIPMLTAVVQMFVLMSMYLLSLSLVMYLFKILLGNSSGLAAAVVLIAAGAVTSSLNTALMWAFPMANTIVWMHYTEILSEPIYPVWSSFVYFGGLLAVLISLNFLALKKLKFTEAAEL